eukprot:138065-Pyramimonas_sp.AAC.1
MRRTTGNVGERWSGGRVGKCGIEGWGAVSLLCALAPRGDFLVISEQRVARARRPQRQPLHTGA